ncbi:MAG: uroporphyrinogen decarboxylase family protein [Victivallales bacterium]
MTEHIKDIVEHFLEVCDSAENRRRTDLMAEHNDLIATEKIPVYFSVPFDWSILRLNLWMKLLKVQLDLEKIMSVTGEYPHKLAEKVIIFQLKQRMFYIEQMPGDLPVTPEITTNFNLLWIRNQNNLNPIWDKVEYNLDTGDFHLEPFINSEGDFDKLKIHSYHFEPEVHEKRINLFTELTGGKLKIQDDNIGFGFLNRIGSPFEEACRTRGMINVLMDMKLNPALLHRTMSFFVKSSIEKSEEMNKTSGRNCFTPSIGGDDINCQMFSPEDYKEFIYPYELECSKYGKKYYYHSCGCLTPIYRDLASLQNLHKIHVSPWSDMGTAVEVFGRKVVIQKLMDTQKDIVNKNTDEMISQIENMKSLVGSSVVEVACHCETFDDFEKSKEFIKLAGERLTR